MTTILQRFRRIVDPGPARALLAKASQPELSADQLEALIARIGALGPDHPPCFALAFTRAILNERMAETRPRDERAKWLIRATRAYEDALKVAESGHVEGIEWIGEAAADRWEPGLDADERAIRATCFRLGLLLCADYRVRDPSRDITPPGTTWARRTYSTATSTPPSGPGARGWRARPTTPRWRRFSAISRPIASITESKRGTGRACWRSWAVCRRTRCRVPSGSPSKAMPGASSAS